jgi:hypothetical protein
LPVAIKQYIDFIIEGAMVESPWENLKKQIYLGSDDFVWYAE